MFARLQKRKVVRPYSRDMIEGPEPRHIVDFEYRPVGVGLCHGDLHGLPGGSNKVRRRRLAVRASSSFSSAIFVSKTGLFAGRRAVFCRIQPDLVHLNLKPIARTVALSSADLSLPSSGFGFWAKRDWLQSKIASIAAAVAALRRVPI
jgi:hypothetical protein